MDGIDLVRGESPSPWGLGGPDTEKSDDRREAKTQASVHLLNTTE